MILRILLLEAIHGDGEKRGVNDEIVNTE